MKISFDLDGTLIPMGGMKFPLERMSWLQKWMGLEPLRKGTPALFKKLQKLGHEVGIYTSSHRPVNKMRLWLLQFRIQPDFIINEALARPNIQDEGLSCSKYTPAFDIHLHIDDAEGVQLEGEKLGFSVTLVGPNDKDWEAKILEAVKVLEASHL